MTPALSIAIRFYDRRNSDVKELIVSGENDIVRFEIYSSVESRGRAEVVIKDRSMLITKQLRIQPDVEVTFIYSDMFENVYTYSTDETPSTNSYLMKSWSILGTEGEDALVSISLIGGKYRNVIPQTKVLYGSTIDAIYNELNERGESVIHGHEWLNYKNQSTDVEPLITADTPRDGGWYNFGWDMYDYISYICNHSNAALDYVFWYYDYIRSTYVISSINQQLSSNKVDRIIWTTDLSNEVTTPIRISGEDYNTWYSSSYLPTSDTGSVYDKLLPNVTYLLNHKTSIDQSRVNFRAFLKSISGSNIDLYGGYKDNIQTTFMNDDNITYGNKKVKRLENLNTHSLHAFSEDYRKFKWSTFSKKIDVNIPYTFGPNEGQFVLFLDSEITKFKDGNGSLDYTYTDLYFVYDRTVLYDATQSNVVVCKLGMMSDAAYVDAERFKYIQEKVYQ